MTQYDFMANHSLDAELAAMQEIATALHRLDQPTRSRVLHWIVERFQADASFIVSGATSIASGAVAGGPAVPASVEPRDETLSVETLNDLFEPSAPAVAAPKAAQPTQSITGMLQDLVAEFQDLAREWNEPDVRPADAKTVEPVPSVAPAAS
jgi:hypothetical protein